MTRARGLSMERIGELAELARTTGVRITARSGSVEITLDPTPALSTAGAAPAQADAPLNPDEWQWQTTASRPRARSRAA